VLSSIIKLSGLTNNLVIAGQIIGFPRGPKSRFALSLFR
jgi:hypothetical protein